MASRGLGFLPLPTRDDLASGPLSPSTPTFASAIRGTNPLSTKVTSVLSTSYADAEFRDALILLDERGVSNSAETRRQLRLNVQKEVIESNGEIITEFGRVAEQLRKIGTTIDKLKKSYGEMEKHVTAAHQATSSTLDEASSLMAQRRNVEIKQRLLNSFREHFLLSEDDVASLTLTSEPVDDRFFIMLTKAKKIRQDCEVLLGFENQTLGLDIMEQTSKHLNAAFQKLYRWIQREFKTLNLENPQINLSIRRALRVLAERPSLFQNCLDFFADAREKILSDAFYLALTGTSAQGREERSVKPIELVAHDSLRYVGDMLAWTHSATVSEREALEVLFVSDGNEIARGIQEGRENELWRLMADEAEAPPEFDAIKALNELVDRDVSGAARILRQRIEQVIQANEDTILAYKLANLLNFYRVTFSKVLGTQSVLLESVANLEAEALRQFRSVMRDHIATLQGEFQHTPSDLGPPDFLQDSMKQLTAIMKTYETSLASAGDNREQEFEPVLTESFDPFISGCENMSQNIESHSNSIFFINCLIAARNALAPFDFTRKRVEQLQITIDKHAEILVYSQYSFFRRESGLELLFDALGPLKDTKEDVAEAMKLDAFSVQALTTASQNLDDFLPSALMDAMENLHHLQDSKLARDVTEEAAEKFCVDFEHVEEMLIFADELAEQEGMNGETEDPDGQHSLRALFPRTTGEIHVLLS